MGGSELFNQSMNLSKEFLEGSVFGALAAVAVIFAIIFFAAFYVYHSLAWYEIAKRQKHKRPWLAWIPLVQFVLFPILAVGLGQVHGERGAQAFSVLSDLATEEQSAWNAGFAQWLVSKVL